MEWVLEHLQFIIVLAGAFAYWLNARRNAANEEKERREGSRPEQRTVLGTPAEDERVRRIQEEIRRKILERTMGQAPPPPAPAAEEPPTRMPRPDEEVAVPPPLPAARRVYVPDEEEIERQRVLLENLRRVEEQRREARALDKAAQAAAIAGTIGLARQDLVPELRNPASLRKAIVLREILGKPVGLR